MSVLSRHWENKVTMNRAKIDEMSRTDIERLIDEWVHNERDRKILKRRLLDGICFEPLAEEFDLSVRQVKRIVYVSEDKVFAHVE